jgi:hypothetical protein
MSNSSSKFLQPWSRKTALAAAAGLFALTLAGASVAQPFGGPGGPGAGGPGWGGMGPQGMGMGMGGMGQHHGFGMHGGPGAGAGHDAFGPFSERMLDAAKQRLNLTSTQQQAWDKAVASGKAARESGTANRQRVRDAMRTELAKLDPDFAAVAKVADDVEQTNRDLRKRVRDEWLALYATFSPAQKAVAREMVSRHVERAEAMRARMQERREQAGGRGPGPGPGRGPGPGAGPGRGPSGS